jgi:hypothetical protein
MESGEMMIPPRLRHEMSLVYNFTGDRERVGVPLRFRLKYDEVIEDLKEKMSIERKFEYLISNKKKV